MPSSSLTPQNLPAGRDRVTNRGHGTESLGPSDSSDSGSDLKGAAGLAGEVDGFGLDHSHTSDTEDSLADLTAGPDVGDANLDSDSDRSGTGERAAAGRDAIGEAGSDIDTDQVLSMPEDDGDQDETGRTRRKREP
jgi:hypothetical protein